MRISFWKRMAFYVVLSIIIMLIMSLFADDSDAGHPAVTASAAVTVDTLPAVPAGD